MLVLFLRFLRGYVSFGAVGDFPERFINLVNYRGIRCWDILPQKGGLSGRMMLSDYLKIRPVARKAGMKLNCTARSGLPFFIRRYSARKGLLIGAALAVVLMSVLSMFVWDVNIVGADTLSEVRLRKALSDNGLSIGALKSGVDIDELERNMMLAVPDIGWISVNLLNNTATVEIKEKDKAPARRKVSHPCNIKASDDGVITKITVYNGSAAVKRGYAVARNALLVSGVVEGKNERLDYVHSNAEVLADVKLDYEIKIPKEKNDIVVSPEYNEKSCAGILGVTFPFALSPNRGEPFAKSYTSYSVSLNNVRLPLNITAERSYTATSEKVRLSAKRAKTLLKKALALRELFRGGSAVLKKRRVTFSQSDSGYTISADIIVNKNIAVKQPISVQ